MQANKINQINQPYISPQKQIMVPGQTCLSFCLSVLLHSLLACLPACLPHVPRGKEWMGWREGGRPASQPGRHAQGREGRKGHRDSLDVSLNEWVEWMNRWMDEWIKWNEKHMKNNLNELYDEWIGLNWIEWVNSINQFRIKRIEWSVNDLNY